MTRIAKLDLEMKNLNEQIRFCIKNIIYALKFINKF